MNRFVVSAIGMFGLSLLLSACGEDPEVKNVAVAPLTVRVAPIAASIKPTFVEAAGTVAIRQETALGFTSAGRIAKLYVQEGEKVRKGQLLAALDVTAVAATLESADAERDRAVADRERLQSLFEEGWVTRPRMEAAEAAARTAEANVRASRFALATARIVAPSNGIVLARLAEPSQIVNAGTQVVILGEETSGYVLRVQVTDRNITAIKQGASVEVWFDALGAVVLNGQVIEIGGRADKGTGAFLVEIALPTDRRLRSGLIGLARIKANALSETPSMILPPGALFSARAGEGFVYVVESDSRAKLRKIRIGETSDLGTLVIGGLSAGERVAVSSLDRLRDGMQVSAVISGP